jgi:hypothetical protein
MHLTIAMPQMHNLTEHHATFMLEKVGAIVAAYVSRNAVGVDDLPGLIDQVHTAISVLQAGAGSGRGGLTGAQIEASIQHDGLISFIGPVVQDAEAPPHRPRAHPRALPGHVRPAGRLPDGRPRLRRQAVGDRPGDPARSEGRLSDDARHGWGLDPAT